VTGMLAHAGHWTSSLIYLTPVLLIVAVLGLQSIRDRRAGHHPDDQHSEPTLDDILDGRKRR